MTSRLIYATFKTMFNVKFNMLDETLYISWRNDLLIRFVKFWRILIMNQTQNILHYYSWNAKTFERKRHIVTWFFSIYQVIFWHERKLDIVLFIKFKNFENFLSREIFDIISDNSISKFRCHCQSDSGIVLLGLGLSAFRAQDS